VLFAAQCVARRLAGNAIVPTAVQRQPPCLVRQEGRELVVDALVDAMVVVVVRAWVGLCRHNAGGEEQYDEHEQ
jgi:hypothetical protein